MAATRAELRRELLALGSPEAAEVLVGLARECIALRRERCDDAAIPIGASKIGGAPDLPPNVEWPQGVYDRLSFLAQVDLAEASPLDPTGLLPKSGLLSFFYEVHAVLHGETMEDERFGRVFWFRDDAQLQRREPPAALDHPSRVRVHWPLDTTETYEPESALYPASRAIPQRSVIPPDDFAALLDPWRSWEGGSQPVVDLCEQYDSSMHAPPKTWVPRHRMFGYPSNIQFDHDAPGSLLLLQLDHEWDSDGMQWGDSGLFYAYISRDDLRRGDFSHVSMTWDCC